MTQPSSTEDPKIEALWRMVLTEGHRHPARVLPGAPKCLVCEVPLKGIGAPVSRMLGRRRSQKPEFLRLLRSPASPGGAEVDVAVLFADVRVSTGIAERVGPQACAALLNHFYKAAIDALVPRRALIDKMVGDEVVALFIPVAGPTYHSEAIEAAVDLQRAVGVGSAEGPWLPLGVGGHSGPAFVGKVGVGTISDMRALGDTANTGARLQAEAKAGEIVLSDETFQSVAPQYPDLEQKTINLPGQRRVHRRARAPSRSVADD